MVRKSSPSLLAGVAQKVDLVYEEVRGLNLLLRGDGTDSNPGILVNIDRLKQESIVRKRKDHYYLTWLWSLSAGVVLWILSLLPSWWTKPVP